MSRIVPELLCRFALLIACGNKIVPLVELLQRCVISQMFHGS